MKYENTRLKAGTLRLLHLHITHKETQTQTFNLAPNEK